jgi:hypothetical protein
MRNHRLRAETGAPSMADPTGAGQPRMTAHIVPTGVTGQQGGRQRALWVNPTISPASELQAELLSDRADIGIDNRGNSDLADGDVGVLQSVSGQYTNDGRSIGNADLQESCHRSG